MFCDWIICSPITTEVSSPVSPSAPSTPTDNNLLVHLDVDVHAEQLTPMNSNELTRASATKNDFLGAFALSSPSKPSPSSATGTTPTTSSGMAAGPRHLFSRTHGLDMLGSSEVGGEMGTRPDVTGGVHVLQPQGFGRDAPLTNTPPLNSSFSASMDPTFSSSRTGSQTNSAFFSPNILAGHTPLALDAPASSLPNSIATPPSMHIPSSTADADASLLLSFTHMLSAGHPTPPTSSFVSSTSLTLTPGYGISPVDRRSSQEYAASQSQSQMTPLSRIQTTGPEKDAHTAVETPSPVSDVPKSQSPSPFPAFASQSIAHPHPTRGKPHPLQNALSLHSPDSSAKAAGPVPLAHPRPQLPRPFAHSNPQPYTQVFASVTDGHSVGTSPASTARSTPAPSPTRPPSSISNPNVKTTRSNHAYGTLNLSNGKESSRERRSPPPPRRFFPLGSPLLVAHSYLTANGTGNSNASLNMTPLSRTQSPAPGLSRQRSRTGTPAPSGSSTPIPHLSVSALMKDLPRGPLDDPFPAPLDENKENHSNPIGGSSGISGAGGAHPYRTRSKQKGASLRIAALVKERDDDLAMIRKGLRVARGDTLESETDSGTSPTTEKEGMDVDLELDADAETDPDVDASVAHPSANPPARSGSRSKAIKNGTKSKSVTPALSRVGTPKPVPPTRPVAMRRSTAKRTREDIKEDEVSKGTDSGSPVKKPRVEETPQSADVHVEVAKSKSRCSPLRKVVSSVPAIPTRRSARNAAKEAQNSELKTQEVEANTHAEEVKTQDVEVKTQDVEVKAQEVEIKAQEDLDKGMESDLSSLPPSSPPPEVVVVKRPTRSKALSPSKSKALSKSQQASTVYNFESEFSDQLTSLSESEDGDISEFDGGFASADEGKRSGSKAKPKPKAKAKLKPAERAVSSRAVDEESDTEEDAHELKLPSPAEAMRNVETFPYGVRDFKNENGQGVQAVHPDFPLLYRRFPVISFFDPGDKRYPPASSAPPSTSGSTFNPPRSALDLYTPRFVKGIGREKCGLCPVCFEPEERGGEGRSDWLSMKFSAFNYHMQYVHGISPSSALPFSPPTAFRRAKRKVNHKNEKSTLLEGHCHRCGEWAPMEGVKCVEAKLKEIYWWKHAAQCHKGSNAPGESSAHIDDELGRKIIGAYSALHRSSNSRDASSSRTTLSLAPRKSVRSSRMDVDGAESEASQL